MYYATYVVHSPCTCIYMYTSNDTHKNIAVCHNTKLNSISTQSTVCHAIPSHQSAYRKCSIHMCILMYACIQ